MIASSLDTLRVNVWRLHDSFPVECLKATAVAHPPIRFARYTEGGFNLIGGGSL